MDEKQPGERSRPSAGRETASSLSRRTLLRVPAVVGLGAVANRFGGRLAEACLAGRAPAFVRLAAPVRRRLRARRVAM
jgi:hypothetical protein